MSGLLSVSGLSWAAGAMLALLALPAAACPDWRQTGQITRFEGTQIAAGQGFSFAAGGPMNLGACPEPGIGWVTAAPQLTMTLRNGGTRDLTFRVEAPCDTVLLINDGRGAWRFNDDAQGLNPALTLPAAVDGVYDVWIGTYGQNRSCQARLTVQSGTTPHPAPAGACPDPGLAGLALNWDAAQLAGGQRASAVAGGALDIRACAAFRGRGRTAEAPDFTLNLGANPGGLDLELRAEAACDPVLLVHGPDGRWHFNDDHEGLNSRILIPGGAPGRYGIWVGTYGARTCPATLIASTRNAAPPAPAQACPDPALTGQTLAWDAAQLAAGQRAPVTAGGITAVNTCAGIQGRGRVDQSPDFTLNLGANPGGADLELRAEAACDPVLLIHGPDGRWHFNDDHEGLNSRILIPAGAPGRYGIWVGTFGPRPCPATLIARTTGGAPPPPAPGAGVHYGLPMLNGARVDWCASWGTDCGQGGADTFCRAVGQTRAQAWEWEYAPRTWVIGASQYCEGRACGALRNVICTPAQEPGMTEVMADPGNLTGLRAHVGQSLLIRVTGSTRGMVWGSEVYTDDSLLAVAAVHAGLVRPGETAVVQVTLLPGQNAYAASSRNGVQSQSYGRWEGSYRLAAPTQAPRPPLAKAAR